MDDWKIWIPILAVLISVAAPIISSRVQRKDVVQDKSRDSLQEQLTAANLRADAADARSIKMQDAFYAAKEEQRQQLATSDSAARGRIDILEQRVDEAFAYIDAIMAAVRTLPQESQTAFFAKLLEFNIKQPKRV